MEILYLGCFLFFEEDGVFSIGFLNGVALYCVADSDMAVEFTALLL